MADPVSLSSDLLTLVAFASQSSKTLYQAFENIQNEAKNVRELKEELNALNEALESLEETVKCTETVLSSLKLPLLSCGRACEDFASVVTKYTAQSDALRTRFRDWARLSYKGKDIAEFRDLITGYEATIIIALAGANIPTAVFTTNILDEYKEMIKNTTTDLEEYLKGIDEKIESNISRFPTDSAPTRYSRDGERSTNEEKAITEQCLRICEQLSSHMEEVRARDLTLTSGLSSEEHTSINLGGITSARLATSKTFDDVKRGLSITSFQLKAQLAILNDRVAKLLQNDETLCGNAPGKLTMKLESFKQRLAILEEVETGDCRSQIITPTLSNLITSKRVTAGARSTKLLGNISDEQSPMAVESFPLSDVQGVTQKTTRRDSHVGEQTQGRSVEYIEQTPTFVDSAYGTANYGQSNGYKLTSPAETASAVQDIDDPRSDYSSLSIVDSKIETYMDSLAEDLSVAIFPLQSDSQRIRAVTNILPELLQQFAFRIGQETSSQDGREIMFYVHKHRRRVAELFERCCTDRNENQDESASTCSNPIPYHDKIMDWFSQQDSDLPFPEDEISEDLDELGSITLVDAEAGNIEKYRKLTSESSAYAWLLTRIGRELTHISQEDDIIQIIRNKISECLPTLSKISRRRQQDPVSLVFKVNWNPKAFLIEQGYSEDFNAVLGRVVTLTGVPTNAQALPCFQYLKQTWPLSSGCIISMLHKLMDTNIDQKVQVDSSDVVLTAWRSPPFLYVKVSGSKSSITEVGEQLAWLGAALRSSPYNGCANCRPHINDSNRIIEEQFELRPGSRQDERKHLNIDFAFDQDDLDGKKEGQCWQSLFLNPVLVRGFPVLRRSSSQYGLEMPLNMIAGLIGAVRAHIFNGAVVLKGFSSMAIPSGQAEDLLTWHIFFDPDGGHVSYLRNDLPLVEGVGLLNLHTLRHIVGWCARTKSYAGRPEANFSIERSRLPTLGTGCVLEKVSITGGMFVTTGFSFGISIKDMPLHLSRKPYLSKLRQIASNYFVFWDTEEKRGWLVNGISALLHLLRASLEHYKTDIFNFALLSQSADISEPSMGTQREYPIRVLLDEHNRALPLYLDKDEEYTEDEYLVGNVPSSATKRKKTFHKLEDRVEELYEILEKIIAHQVNVTGKAGVNLKAHARRRLEGWDFKDLASDRDPSYPRSATLHACGKGWIDFVRSIHAVTLFGKGFGELIRSSDNTDCLRWTQVPKDRYYLAALVSDLRQIMEEDGNKETNPMQLCNGISWFSSSTTFDACQCAKAPGSGHSDFVQTLWPTSLRKLLPHRERLPLHNEGAVIFGHNATLKWKWPDKGNPVRGDPALEPAIAETEEEFHDSGIGTTDPDGSEQIGSMPPDSGNSDMISLQQSQATGSSFAEPELSSTKPTANRAAGVIAADQTDIAKSAGQPPKHSRLEKVIKYLPWASSKTKQR